MSESEGSSGARVLVADPMYADVASSVDPTYEELDLVCADEEHSATDLASDGIVGLITQDAAVDADLLEQLPDLDVVLSTGRNYQHVDVDAVRDRDVTFASVPRKGPNCVAELALTFILSLSKDLLVSHDSVASGAYRMRGLKPEVTAQWEMAYHWMKNTRVHEVRHKTLGIVGMGEIGCELARRASVLGMHTLYYKRTPLSPELEGRFDASYRDLNSLLKESDYVCLAVPHTPETEDMIGEQELALMNEDAFLVNICRGGVVDEEALVSALEEKRIAGAGLDVFEYEPLPEDSPLCTLDNVILTPHMGGGTGTSPELELQEALVEMGRILSGAEPTNDLSDHS
jgi:phosphoglycerate dehydrogenase-like enzyme